MNDEIDITEVMKRNRADRAYREEMEKAGAPGENAAPQPEASDREIAERLADELEVTTRKAINFDPSCLPPKRQARYEEQRAIEKAAWIDKIVEHDATIRADERRKACEDAKNEVRKIWNGQTISLVKMTDAIDRAALR